jgi:hypothetical protein
MHGVVLESRHVPPGANLKRTFVAAMLEWINAGWQLREFSSVSARSPAPAVLIGA